MTDHDYAAMLATPADQRDGRTYLTGLRIEGQHCGNCGRPDSTQPTIRYHDNGMGETELVATPCCSVLPCGGYVGTRAWEAKTDPSRTVWACCRGVASRYLGEPAWLPLVVEAP